MREATSTITVAVAGCAQSAYAQVGKPVTIVDANTITEADLAKLPGMTPALAKNLVAKRPFLSITTLDQFLTGAGLSREQITALYGRIFINVNLNSASRDEILLIPGVGNRMLREFLEYRPYAALAVFHREIDKYVDDTELARLEQYVSIPRLALAGAERFPNGEAIVDGDRRISYPELAREVVRSTRAAIAAGIQPGDRAAIWAPNSSDWIIAALGVLGAGGAIVTLNTRFKGGEAAYVLRKSGVRVLFLANDFLDTNYGEMLRTALAETGDDLADLDRVVVLSGDVGGDTAWADYTSGQWDLCISGFDMYLRTFPRSDLADEAQFYIGECHYADGKNQEAVQAYTQVITNYPRGQSVAPAYYKRGLAFERLGQVDRARESFEAVVKSFPDSDAARLAKQNLDRLNRGRPPL